jgi:hypothetical protein
LSLIKEAINMENDMKNVLGTMSILLLLMTLGCTKHQVETKSQVEVAPVEIKPIHITIDVNIRVDKALDDFFSDIDESAQDIK